jgi:DNA-binding CsgD family transcriptional regulator
MNEPAPVRADDALDWLHEQGKRRSEAVPEFDAEETLRKVRTAGQLRVAEEGHESSPASTSADDRGYALGSLARYTRVSFAEPPGAPSDRLNAREREVLELVARALSNRQIAIKLKLTEGTVKRHLRNIYVKLGAVSRIDAVNKAGVSLAEADNRPAGPADRELLPPQAPQTRPEAPVASAAFTRDLEPLIASLETTKNAVIRIGTVLIVKVDRGLNVFRLTTRQQMILDHSPKLTVSPHKILTALGLTAEGRDGEDLVKPGESTSFRAVDLARAEVNLVAAGVLIRDSKDPEAPIVRFTAEEWDAFMAAVKHGEFDLP